MEDSNLLAHMGKGDEPAFAAIYARYALPLYRYAAGRVHSRIAAEDIVQEIFIKLWEKREALSHVTALKSYLFAAVRHKVADHISFQLVRDKYAQHYSAFTTRQHDGIEELLYAKDLRRTIERNIAVLPEKCQTAFKLSRFEDMTIANIAKQMNLSTGTVENYITLAVNRLRKTLNK